MRFTEDLEHPQHPPPPYMYSCTIEADAKVLQKKDGGMESVRKAFRSMFGRKKREEIEPKTRNAANTTKTPVNRSNVPARSDPVPSTHPLAAQRAEKRLSIVPQGQAQRDGTAGFKPVTPVAAASQDKIHPAIRESPPRMTGHAIGSAITSDRRESRGPAPPPKDEGVADAVMAAPPEAAAAAPAVTEAQPAHIQSTGEPDVEPKRTEEEPTSTESIKPLNIVKATDSTPDTEPTEPTNTAEPSKENVKPNGIRAPAVITDDKMLVDEEHPLPAIKPIQPAPGMSATSGPLEDFPEGDFR